MTTATEERPAIEERALPEIGRLARADLREAALTMEADAARYFVDLYYEVQEFRMTAAHRVRQSAPGESDEGPASLDEWAYQTFRTTESLVHAQLDEYTMQSTLGQWTRSIYGIGPVITAGLLAHIDIEHGGPITDSTTKPPTRGPVTTVGHIWRFAGLDPTVTWDRGQKRPYNARLKVLCWKLGDSFVKFSKRDDCMYGHVYRRRKQFEVDRNESGANAETAKQTLEDRKIKEPKTRKRYEEGRLPDGRVDLRARRIAVKLFLSHYHHVGYELLTGEAPPKPWAIAYGGHADYIPPPNWPMEAVSGE